jgi:hypothetical protein
VRDGKMKKRIALPLRKITEEAANVPRQILNDG